VTIERYPWIKAGAEPAFEAAAKPAYKYGDWVWTRRNGYAMVRATGTTYPVDVPAYSSVNVRYLGSPGDGSDSHWIPLEDVLYRATERIAATLRGLSGEWDAFYAAGGVWPWW
jgi:hypothetical protein